MCKIFVACVSDTNGAVVMDPAAGEGYRSTPLDTARRVSADTLLRCLLWCVVNGLYVDRIVLSNRLLERLHRTAVCSRRLADMDRFVRATPAGREPEKLQRKSL